MQAPELSLAAAIRDATAERLDARHKALRSLAPAFLVELGKPGPRWDATAGHDDEAAVLDALYGALRQSEDVPLGALAAIGLGMLGQADVLDVVAPWVELEGDAEEASFRRECAVITTGYVGVAAATADVESARVRVAKRLRGWFDSPYPDVRFQAALALVDVEGNAVEATFASALRKEDHPEVREALVDALSRLDTLGTRAVAALQDVLDDEEDGPGLLGFEAAMVLAGARETRAGPRLLAALRVRHQRDRALEALAVLGTDAPIGAAGHVRQLASSVWTPGTTRVRAAYALARIEGGEKNAGHTWLQRLRWHPSAGVREAVRDAQTNLTKLAPRA